jgi:DNA-binding protein HU-beta
MFLYFKIINIMTKTQLIEVIAKKLNLSKKLAATFVDTFVDAVVMGVKKEGDVRIQGFGTFKVSKRNARNGVNPRTRAKIRIPAMKLPAFKAGAEFKKAVR